MFDSFDRYRMIYGNRPVSSEERNISKALLQNEMITKAIGMKMLTDGNKNNDLLGYMLLAGGHL